MFSLLIIIGIAVLLYFMIQRRNNSEQEVFSRGSMGSLMSGMLLGYLLNNFLITNQQYELWNNLSIDELKDKLTAEGIIAENEFDSLVEQAQEEGTYAKNDAYDTNDYNDESNSDNGFGGNDFNDSGDW